jgi:hypothetical protein
LAIAFGRSRPQSSAALRLEAKFTWGNDFAVSPQTHDRTESEETVPTEFHWNLFRRHATVHASVRLRDLVQIKILDLHGTKWLGRDDFSNIKCQRTTVGDEPLQSVQPALPLENVVIRAEAVFEQQESTARFEDAIKLSHGLVDVRNAAQRDRADDTVKRACFEWECFAADDPFVDVDARLLDSPLEPFVHARIRVGCRDFCDVVGIVWQIQTGTDSDFQNLTGDAGQLLLTVLRPNGLVHQAVVEPGKDDTRIETQLKIPSTTNEPGFNNGCAKTFFN